MNNGILNILKPPGMTSHDVVSYVRRLYGLKKVGHAGTLDPAAAGVLPIFLGQATRLIEYTANATKSYRAEMTFGFETDTGDDTGTIVRKGETVLPERQQVEAALSCFRGLITQTPPVYSAIKIGGKKLYELARAGRPVEPPPRQVQIDSLILINEEPGKILIDVDCSKGTYIRTLCQDIGRHLGCLATMSFLIRTRVGSFDIQQAVTLEEAKANPKQVLLPLDAAIQHLPLLMLDPVQSKDFCQGKTVPVAETLTDAVRVYGCNQVLLGIGQSSNQLSVVKPVKVVASLSTLLGKDCEEIL